MKRDPRLHGLHLRTAAAAASAGDLVAAATFARLLIEHVRFEERVVFPAVEEALPGEVLDAVAHRAPAAAAPRAD
jgi:hemerythrin-like domain-containing protein